MKDERGSLAVVLNKNKNGIKSITKTVHGKSPDSIRFINWSGVGSAQNGGLTIFKELI